MIRSLRVFEYGFSTILFRYNGQENGHRKCVLLLGKSDIPVILVRDQPHTLCTEAMIVLIDFHGLRDAVLEYHGMEAGVCDADTYQAMGVADMQADEPLLFRQRFHRLNRVIQGIPKPQRPRGPEHYTAEEETWAQEGNPWL